MIESRSGNLTAAKASFHLRGSHRVTFRGDDAATMLSHGYAWNRMDSGALEENGGEALREVWGTYEHGFPRRHRAQLGDVIRDDDGLGKPSRNELFRTPTASHFWSRES